MKNLYNSTYRLFGILVLGIALLSCEQESLEAELGIADGSGTLSSFIAYSIDSVPGEGNIYGRMVFWKDNLDRTLVQMSLYDTQFESIYSSGIMSGSIGNETTSLMALSDVEGKLYNDVFYYGEFSGNKFFVISDTGFYDSILPKTVDGTLVPGLDAHVNITIGGTIVAAGNIGDNTTPVEQN